MWKLWKVIIVHKMRGFDLVIYTKKGGVQSKQHFLFVFPFEKCYHMDISFQRLIIVFKENVL